MRLLWSLRAVDICVSPKRSPDHMVINLQHHGLDRLVEQFRILKKHLVVNIPRLLSDHARVQIVLVRSQT